MEMRITFFLEEKRWFRSRWWKHEGFWFVLLFFFTGGGIISSFLLPQKWLFYRSIASTFDRYRWQHKVTKSGHPGSSFSAENITESWAGVNTTRTVGVNDKKSLLVTQTCSFSSVFCQTWPGSHMAWVGFSFFFIDLSVRDEVPYCYICFDKC